VAHVLEGSVRRAGKRVRINAQLVDSRTGGHVWAERYDGELEDIFDLQDEIAGKIIAALPVSLTATPAPARGTSNVAAYELMLKGRAKFYQFTPETNAECLALLDRAVALDPTYSNAWAEQVFPYQSGFSFGWKGYDDGLQIALEKAERAVALDPDSSLAHCRMGWLRTIMKEPDAAIASFERSVALDPNNADTHIWFSDALNFAGQPARGIEAGKIALHFDPVAPPNVFHHIAHSHYLLGKLDAAREFENRAVRIAPLFPPARIVLAATLVELGLVDEARDHVADLQRLDPRFTASVFLNRYPYRDGGQSQRIANALVTAGLAP